MCNQFLHKLLSLVWTHNRYSPSGVELRASYNWQSMASKTHHNCWAIWDVRYTFLHNLKAIGCVWAIQISNNCSTISRIPFLVKICLWPLTDELQTWTCMFIMMVNVCFKYSSKTTELVDLLYTPNLSPTTLRASCKYTGEQNSGSLQLYYCHGSLSFVLMRAANQTTVYYQWCILLEVHIQTWYDLWATILSIHLGNEDHNNWACTSVCFFHCIPSQFISVIKLQCNPNIKLLSNMLCFKPSKKQNQLNFNFLCIIDFM